MILHHTEAREVLQQEKDTLLEEKRAYTQDIEHTQNKLIEATQTIETQKTTIYSTSREKHIYARYRAFKVKKSKWKFEEAYNSFNEMIDL